MGTIKTHTVVTTEEFDDNGIPIETVKDEEITENGEVTHAVHSREYYTGRPSCVPTNVISSRYINR